jgi:transcription elongation factor SPT4
MSQVPRQLRACLVCSFVQPFSKFIKNGCPNCEPFLEMRNSSDVVQDCTSEVFEGVLQVSDTATSWVAKWQRLEGYVPGMYAVKVNGVVSSSL